MIGRNFIFMGLEVVITLVCTLLTTVVIARVIGPTRLGYFNLIFWLTSITCSVGSLGIPLTTFKYMGEFLGGGKKELARAVFFYNLWAQTVIACVLTAIGMIAVFTIVDPAYRVCSVLLVLSMVPNMITFVPSQANSAAEDAALNTRGAFVGAIVYVVAVAASLLLGWNLIGIAAGVLLYRTAELAVKTVPVLKSMKSVARVPLPREIRKRMFSFSGLSTGLMILQIVIWDRSDIIFLKLLQPDIRQLAFFSVCFSVADRLMRMPQTFANALSATQMAEYGRDKDRLFRMTSKASTYVLLGALPILIGLACIGGPFVRVMYGPQYLPAIPVFIVVALLSIPRAILTPAQTLLYSAEDLGFVLKWGCVAAAINVAPRFGFDSKSRRARCSLGKWRRPNVCRSNHLGSRAGSLSRSNRYACPFKAFRRNSCDGNRCARHRGDTVQSPHEIESSPYLSARLFSWSQVECLRCCRRMIAGDCCNYPHCCRRQSDPHSNAWSIS